MKKHNDLDRDIAKGINSILSECLTLVNRINDNKFVPHITTQPTNAVVAVGEDAVFTVIANNAVSYQWEAKTTEEGSWVNSSAIGATTNSMSITASTARYAYSFRCKITGKDNSILYTDVVKMVAPES